MSTIDLGQLADPNSPTGDSGAGGGRTGLTRVFPHVTPKLWVGAGMIAARMPMISPDSGPDACADPA